MSIFAPTSAEARRTFCPRLPMASESWSSSTMHSRVGHRLLALLLDAFLGGHQGDPRDLRGGKRVLRVGDDVLGELDDVDPLAPQLARDRLDARTAHADAGADRVDVPLARGDRHLGAVAGLADAAADDDRPVVDLGDLHLHEPHQELGRRPRQDDLRPLGVAVDVDEDAADPLALRVPLGAGLVLARDDRLGPSEVDDHVAALEALHRAGDELAHLRRVLVVDVVPLGLADLLVEDLLGALGGDAPQPFRRPEEADLVPDRRPRRGRPARRRRRGRARPASSGRRARRRGGRGPPREGARSRGGGSPSPGRARAGGGRHLADRDVLRVDRRGRGDLRLRLLLDDPVGGPGRQLARRRVEARGDLAHLVDLARRRRDRLLERGDEPVEVDLLVARGGFEGVEHLDRLGRGRSLGRLGGLRGTGRPGPGGGGRGLGRAHRVGFLHAGRWPVGIGLRTRGSGGRP